MAQGDVLEAKFKFNVARNPAAFTLKFQQQNTADQATDNSCLGLIEALKNEANTMNFLIATDATYEGFECRVLQGTPFPPAFAQLDNAVGVRTGQSIPLLRAGVVRLLQSTAPAKNNGRIYFPGISENDTTINQITDVTVINGLDALFNALLLVEGNSQGIDWAFNMVVMAAIRTGNPNPTPYPVTSVNAQAILYSQRSRRTREYGTVPTG